MTGSGTLRVSENDDCLCTDSLEREVEQGRVQSGSGLASVLPGVRRKGVAI